MVLNNNIDRREQVKDIANKHKRRIEKEDKKYPLMEYFLSNKSLDDCSKECQRQVKELRNCDLIV